MRDTPGDPVGEEEGGEGVSHIISALQTFREHSVSVGVFVLHPGDMT